ncbi:MAG: butyrate kinase [candidate division Zixibacteria bacterium]|nr:butyrate kinase [candidate division Zixibacteria bacterium]
MNEVIIVINPGSTSTKMALFAGQDCLAMEAVLHPADELHAFANVADQFDLRMHNIDGWLMAQAIEQKKVIAVAGRGAPVRPLKSGIYRINDTLLDDLRTMRYSNHASNLGAIIADHLGKRYDVPAVIADPITLDDFPEIAKVSGVPGIERKCRVHALNIREVSRREAAKMDKTLEECNFVTVHMGGGVSVAAVERGRIVDVNDALLGMGPYSVERAGALPIGALVKMAFSGEYTEPQLVHKLSHESGLKGYLGENDLREVEKMIDAGNAEAKLYYDAMIYQIAKEIAIMATVLKGKYESIILTGGMARSERLVIALKEYIAFLGAVVVVPGEFEMEALAAAAVRVLDGSEIPKAY